MNVKNWIIAPALLGLVHGVTPAEESAAPTTASVPAEQAAEVMSDNEKILYSLGYELGKDIKRQDLELSREMLLKGVDDALSGTRPLVNTSGRQKALRDIKKRRAGENLKASLAFLAANAEKEGVKTLPSGLQYKELRAGEGKTPESSGRVTVNYRGTLIDGTEFDSSYERGQPSTFDVRKVIKGWREALLLMKEGAKWELYIPPDLAYGQRSPRDRIPANSALIYEVELLSVAPAPPKPPRPAPRPPVPEDE